MKAIETQYAGVRFRSRLEARWALFFDACHAPWVYEREAFALPSGNYLPDFWLRRASGSRCCLRAKHTPPSGAHRFWNPDPRACP